MKKVLFFSVIIISLCITGNGDALESYIKNIAQNQMKIKSEIAAGKIHIKLYNDDKLMQTISRDILLYLKHPDKIKISTNSDKNDLLEIVQKGDQIIQKAPGNGVITRKKATKENDLFANYLGYGIANILDSFTVAEKNDYDDNTIEYKLIPQKNNTPIDYYIIRIDKQTGMNIYESYYSQGSQTFEVYKEYKKIDSIYILKNQKLVVKKQAFTIETIVSYGTIQLNIKIADKEFELQ